MCLSQNKTIVNTDLSISQWLYLIAKSNIVDIPQITKAEII